MSAFFEIQFGVKQGSVLSPFLFAVYVDDLCELCIEDRMRFIFVYAHDIILICPSVVGLEDLLHQCENEPNSIDMAINTNKSSCLRIGNRNDKHCANLKTLDGREINSVVLNLGSRDPLGVPNANLGGPKRKCGISTNFPQYK